MELLKQLHCLWCSQRRNRIYHRRQIRQSTTFRFFCPFRCITVAVEHDSLMINCIFFDQIMYCHIKIFGSFQTITCFFERFCCNRIKYNVTFRNRISGSYHTEFKFVSGKRKRWSTVTVCRIFHEIRKSLNTCLQKAAFLTVRSRSGADQLIKHISELFSKEYGNNSRRSFVSAKSLVISNICRRFAQKVGMCIYCFEDTGQNQKELYILMRCLPRIQKIDSVICSQWPVVVFTGAIYACKWFLMKQATHTMAAGYFLQDAHHDLIMICCNIYRCIDRCQFMLCRCNFIMLCLCCHTKFPAFFIYFLHISRNSLTDSSKIMIIHLLTFRRHRTKQSSSCICKIFSLQPFFFIYKKIFLFSTNRWCYLLWSCIAKKAKKT